MYIKGHKNSEESERKRICSLRKYYENPDNKRRMAEKVKEALNKEETRKRMSESHKGQITWMKGKKASEETRKKQSVAAKKRTGENACNWQGGVSFGKYCPKFNSQKKEEIREKFEHMCFRCGKTEIENGRKLDIHHIDSDKEQGCNGKRWELIPLCRSCHMKTNGKNVKNYWQQFFRDMIKLYNIRETINVVFGD